MHRILAEDSCPAGVALRIGPVGSIADKLGFVAVTKRMPQLNPYGEK